MIACICYVRKHISIFDSSMLSTETVLILVIIRALLLFAQLFVLAGLSVQSQTDLCHRHLLAKVPERQMSCYTDTGCYSTLSHWGYQLGNTNTGFSLQCLFA